MLPISVNAEWWAGTCQTPRRLRSPKIAVDDACPTAGTPPTSGTGEAVAGAGLTAYRSAVIGIRSAYVFA